MAIFDSNITKLQRDVESAQRIMDSQYGQLLGVFYRVKRLVWENPDHTPQQVLDVFGTNAAKLFQMSDWLVTLLASLTGQTLTVIPDNYTYVINPDGTVTVTEQQSSSSSSSSAA